MEQLAILDKIFENFNDTSESGTATYIFAAAIYDTWCNSDNKLEKNLAQRLISAWEIELEEKMIEAYKKTKYDENRPEPDGYYKKWIDSCYSNEYHNHLGLRRALINLWEVKKGYGIKLWPKY